MAITDTPTIDQYSGFDHKQAMNQADIWLAGWVPLHDHRRQMSYIVAGAIHEQVSRLLLPSGSKIEKEELREYGDPQLYSGAVAAGVIGSQIQFVVAGADAQLPAQPVLPFKPEPPSEPDDEGVLAYAHAKQINVWRSNSKAISDKWEADHLAQPSLREAQEWLREWNLKDRFESKLREVYKDVVLPEGEAIIAFRAVPGQYPESELFDPADYFPDFPDHEVTEFADRVILAYEYTDSETGSQYLRRVRYELVPLIDERTGLPTSRPSKFDGDPPETAVCVMTDAHFKLASFDDEIGLAMGSVLDLDEDKAEWYATTTNSKGEEVPVRNLDLGFDFIPLIHLPAGPASRTHFGRSMYLRGAMLFDDIAATDTDIMSASGLAGNPPMVVSGALMAVNATTGKVDMGPGRVLSTPDGGSLNKLAMSEELNALLKHGTELRRRLSQIMQVPEGMLGQVSAEEVVSGIALALSFTPFEQYVMESRLALIPKLNLGTKMVMRLAVIAKSPGWEKIRTLPRAAVELGSFMPSDTPALVELIVGLRSSKVISRSLAAQWLAAAGLKMGDINQLLAELNSEDTESALDLEAMFGPEIAARYLDIEFDAEAHQAEEDAANADTGAFGPRVGVDRDRARPQRPAQPGENPADPNT